MKKYIILVLIGVVFSSCASRKNVTTKTQKKTTSKPIVKNDNTSNNSKQNSISKPPVINNTRDYIDAFKAIAISEMREHRIPASITLAQGILESGSGKGRLSVEANNHFGIKCHGWAGKKIYHDDDALQECFRKYDNAKYSFQDHSNFLKKRRYAPLFNLNINDYKSWAKGLRKAGYATDKKYPEKLIAIIERYNLTQYDEVVAGKPLKTASEKRYTVVKGDTLYAISKRYNISVKTLQKLNNIKGTNINVGQVLNLK